MIKELRAENKENKCLEHIKKKSMTKLRKQKSKALKIAKGIKRQLWEHTIFTHCSKMSDIDF